MKTIRIKRAARIGFCFGVKRAIEMAEAALAGGGKVYSLGSIIHNTQVVNDLSQRGLEVRRDIRSLKNGAVVISSHGTSPRVIAKLRQRRLGIIDTTCPFVLHAQKLARSLSDAGYTVVIVGDAQHPEVRALVDFVSTRVIVVNGPAEARRVRLAPTEAVGIISQTTQATENFLDVVRVMKERSVRELRIVNTICNDAQMRQEAALRLAPAVDVMIVIGGKHSANSRRLYDVCRKTGAKTYFVETASELKCSWLRGVGVVGVTSGASTPQWLIQEVVSKIQAKSSFRKKNSPKRRMST